MQTSSTSQGVRSLSMLQSSSKCCQPFSSKYNYSAINNRMLCITIMCVNQKLYVIPYYKLIQGKMSYFAVRAIIFPALLARACPYLFIHMLFMYVLIDSFHKFVKFLSWIIFFHRDPKCTDIISLYNETMNTAGAMVRHFIIYILCQ